MGFFQRLLGRDPASRMDKARRFLAEGAFNDARWELEDLDHPDAAALREESRLGLVNLNLDEAAARFRSADFAGAQEHLNLAKEFGATTSQLREVRRVGREERARKQAEEAAKAEAELVLEGNDPLWGLPPDDPRIRYALLPEGWPDDLRERLARLGPDFARTVMLIEDGKGGDHPGPLSASAHQQCWLR